MTRYIRLAVHSELTDSDYADLANTIWMVLRSTPHDFHVEHDGKTPAKVLNESWEEYGARANWD